MNANSGKCSCNMSDLSTDSPLTIAGKIIAGDRYTLDMLNLSRRIVYNYRKNVGFEFSSNFLLGAIEPAQVQAIVNAYMNVVKGDLSLPIYSPSQYKAKDSNQKRLMETVSKNSGQNLTNCELTLFELFWGTRDGSIQYGSLYLNPRDAKLIKQYTETPGFIESPNPLNTLAIIAIVAGIGVALFYGSSIVKNVKEIAD